MQISRCLPNCWAQIELSGAQWVLLVGNYPLRSLFPWHLTDGIIKSITEMRGMSWHWKERYWTSCVHPAAALRQEKYMDMFAQDIRGFVHQVRNGPNVGEHCFKCGKDVDLYTAEGVPWCRAHAPN